ncbi:septation protein SepH [Allobranchiibius sp. CTAmp26]|uniref:septation protein SepH n=1 Tax=Allobranchiibius sp. CTAmp26 TaxID=2815214 RepID=UPI001AA113E1|nr:septation protein SepH [Allobranchiibius sp. CTAmp26]MBO1755374.1 DUF3071 domain-containing protein [Allobranchiibius sp. CTAmp26]
MRDLKVSEVDGADLHLVDDDGGRYRLSVDDRVRESVAAAATAAPPTDTESSRDGAPHAEEVTSGADTAAGADTRAVSAAGADTRAVSLVSEQPAAPIGDLPHLPPGELVTPRAVQELLRAGHSVGHVAAAAGWDQAKVERYAAPIEAERSYIAGLAQDLPVGPTTTDTATTVGDRVAARLHDRGVTGDAVAWDAHRTAGRGWVVVCRFSAGGRTREASWLFRAATRTLTAVDDEARWLGEDERAAGGPIPAPAAPVKVFDVEAEGGVSEPGAPSGSAGAPADAGSSGSGTSATSAGAVDLVSAMQARSRGRRTRGSRNRAGRTPVDVPPIESPSDPSDVTQAAPTQPQPVPVQQPGQTGHEADRADPADQPGHALADETPAEPTVDDLGHDPVTGTVDLFGAVAEQSDDSGSAHGQDDGAAEAVDSEQTQGARPADLDQPNTTTATTEPERSEPASTTGSDDATGADEAAAEPEPVEDAGSDDQQATEEVVGHGATAVDALQEGERAAPAVHAPGAPGATAVRDDEQPSEQLSDQAEELDSAGQPDEALSPAPPRRPSGARSGRPSVPSWDDIMFGGRRGRD